MKKSLCFSSVSVFLSVSFNAFLTCSLLWDALLLTEAVSDPFVLEPKISNISSFILLRKSNESALYSVELTDPSLAYKWPIYFIDLHGSRFQIGYDYGVLVGLQAEETYRTFLDRLIGSSVIDKLLISFLEKALDWQWDSFLSKQVPSCYLEEIKGMSAGGIAMGVPSLEKLVTRIITLANAPGDLSDFIYILIREWNESRKSEQLSSSFHDRVLFDDRTIPLNDALALVQNRLKERRRREKSGMQCSMFGIWGSRTLDGDLFTARNLDWNKDMGIQENKLISVYHPNDGAYAHATIGYTGFIGALTGISSRGLTVHEANLEENMITFEGFPWVLRLRFIMENAKNLVEAKNLWDATNNTVGFNHMIGSAIDSKSLVEETMYEYTAYFFDNDEREASAVYIDPESGEKSQLGFPLREALYRTNHGYDPLIREHYQSSQAPDSWSMQRYMFIYRGISWYQSADIRMNAFDAINITSIAADKGPNAYSCQNNYKEGSNVLSVTFHPSKNTLYAAWEDGTGSSWTPAACNCYVAFEMSDWWTHSPAIEGSQSVKIIGFR